MLDNIKRKLRHMYGEVELKQLAGGYTNGVYLIEGTDPVVVAKISDLQTKDGLYEYNCLCLLKNSHCAPNIYNMFEVDHSRILLIEYLSGVNGQSILNEDDQKKAEKVYELLGKYLSLEIHTIKHHKPTTNLPIIKRHSGDYYKLDFVPRSLMVEVERILGAESSEEDYVLIHGDYGPHNALLSHDTTHIIDWEWAGWGNPIQDVSWILWFLKLHYPERAQDLFLTFIATYRKYSEVSISSELLKTYAISRVMNVINNKINPANIEVKKEWIRRLNWTLQTDFNID